MSRPWNTQTPLNGYEPDWAGQFDTFDDWCNHAARALTDGPRNTIGGEIPAICIDGKGRRVTCGGDFMRARDDGSFPVRYFWDFRLVQGELSIPDSRSNTNKEARI